MQRAERRRCVQSFCLCGLRSRLKVDARVLVLTGAGNAFLLPGRIWGIASRLRTLIWNGHLRDEYMPLIDPRLVRLSRLPTIAAVNGAAAGAGANLALAADVVIASRERLCSCRRFARIGIIPGCGRHLLRCHGTIGHGKGNGGRAVSRKRSRRARRSDWGMIWEAVPDAELRRTTGASRASHLAAGSDCGL